MKKNEYLIRDLDNNTNKTIYKKDDVAFRYACYVARKRKSFIILDMIKGNKAISSQTIDGRF